MDIELAYMPAHHMATAVKNKQLSPVEIVRNSLERIEQVNPVLNCFCFVYPDEALKLAQEAESAVMRGEAVGPLHGVPIAIKDFTPTRGKRTTRGSYALENWVPEQDARIVEKLRAAGAIMVGKTTTSEFALAGFTETPLWGITRNPWDTGRACGGSSGGSGVAVAAGCVPLAEGCDMGGSVRIPSAFCGITGIKPSFGRIPFDILPSQFDTFCHFGPLARDIDDAALFIAAAQGPDDADILTDPLPLDERALRNLTEFDPRALRVALSVDLGYYAVDPEVAANTRRAAALLQEYGATVEEVDLQWTREINDAGWLHWCVYTALIAEQYLGQYRDCMEPFVVMSIEQGQRTSALDLKRVEAVRSKAWAEIRPILAQYDVLLCPTLAVPAPPVGTTDLDWGKNDENGRYVQFEMTFPFNMLSPLPALTTPSGFTNTGLPTGLQIVGRRFDDLTVLRIGKLVERILGIAPARPSINP